MFAIFRYLYFAGVVQVFRVEHAQDRPGQPSSAAASDPLGKPASAFGTRRRYLPLTELVRVETDIEGSVLAVDHWNCLSESLLVYGTESGVMRGWDLRMRGHGGGSAGLRQQAFRLDIDPALGLLTCLEVGRGVRADPSNLSYFTHSKLSASLA